MNREHIELMIEGANSILPENYLPETEFNENEWGASLSVARFLLDIGLETLKEFEKGKSILTRTQSWLVAIIQKGKLNRRERVEAGNMLAKIGDPRFDSKKWYLPDEPLLGFVKIPKGSFIMGEKEEQHEISLPTFYIARYPVTVAQFRAFVLDSEFALHFPEALNRPDNHPMVLVSWHEAIEYLNWLNKKLVSIGKGLQVSIKEKLFKGGKK